MKTKQNNKNKPAEEQPEFSENPMEKEDTESELRIKKSVSTGKLVEIELADGTTIHMDTKGMKGSDIQEMKEGLYAFVNDGLVEVSKKDRHRNIRHKRNRNK